MRLNVKDNTDILSRNGIFYNSKFLRIKFVGLFSLMAIYAANGKAFSKISMVNSGHAGTAMRENPSTLSSVKLRSSSSLIKVNGTVTDTLGTPVVGATIRVKGKNTGASTDKKGNFAIEAASGDILVVSSIGYLPREITVDGSALTIVLQQEVRTTDVVVVTALGIKRSQKALSYEVQSIKREDLTTVQNANFANGLTGKIAGVSISPSASGIGGATRVVMRGVKSIGQVSNNKVLYVIDGVPLFNQSSGDDAIGVFGGMSGTESIADFNPDDFESINVMTGPAGAALYGSEAANGVIIITTRKGSQDGLKLNYSNNTTFLSPLIKPEFQNTYGNRVGEYKNWGSKLKVPSNYDPFQFFKTGVQQINSLNASIGNDRQQSFLSFSSTNGKGVIPNNKYNRYNFTFRNTASFLDDKLTSDFSASFVNQIDQNMASQGRYNNPLPALYLFPRNDDFDAIKYYERYSTTNNYPIQYWPYGTEDLDMQNPYWITNRTLYQNNRRRYMFSGSLTYKIAQGINITGRGRIDNSNGILLQKKYSSTAATFAGPNGFFSSANQNINQSYADLIATFNRIYGDFSINANLGGSFSKLKTTTEGSSGRLEEGTVANLFSVLNIKNVNHNAISEPFSNIANFAGFASMELGYKNYLFLSTTGRHETNSRQVNSLKEASFYPSVGLSALISSMVKLPEPISYLKLRGNYASVGLPLNLQGVTPGTETNPITGGEVTSRKEYPFPDFTIQRSKTYELGMNLKMFKNKLGLDVTLYKSNTFDQLFKGDLSTSTGFTSKYFQAGKVENKGIEAALNFQTNLGHDLSYNTGFTFTLNRNKIVELTGDDNIKEQSIDGDWLVEGNRVGDLYTDRFLATDPNGDIYLTDKGDFSIITGKKVNLGNTNPDFTLGWRNDLSYKNFSLGFLIFGRFGGIVLSQTQQIMDRYGVSPASAKARDAGGVMINGQLYSNVENYYAKTSDLDEFYTYNATNIRLQELYLSYKLPRKMLNDKLNLSFSVLANNLWMIYNKAPFDPQITPSTGTFYQGKDYFMMPSMRSFGFSIKAQF